MKNTFVIFILIILVFSSCVKKELNVGLTEPQCKGFKIKGIQYQFISDPTCDSSKNTGILAITGSIDGDTSCINSMTIEAEFYDINSNKLQPLTGGSEKIQKKDIAIVNGTFSVKIEYTFNKDDYAKLNYVHLKYYTENELGESSNNVTLRANPPCAMMIAPTQFDKTFTISDTVQYITVNLSDHAAQDGDLISMNVNGTWVLENILLTNQGNNYNVPVAVGNNWFYIYALNQGSEGLNTVTVDVRTNVSDTTFVYDLKTGESRAFKIIIQ